MLVQHIEGRINQDFPANLAIFLFLTTRLFAGAANVVAWKPVLRGLLYTVCLPSK